MKAEKRHKFRIYFEVLSVLDNGERRGDKLSSTVVARKVNMAYDRFQRHLGRLVELDFVESPTSLVLTEKGIKYVEEYRRFENFLRRMGLLER